MNVASMSVAYWKKRALNSKHCKQKLQHDYQVLNNTLDKHFVPIAKKHQETKKSGKIDGNFIFNESANQRALGIMWPTFKLLRKKSDKVSLLAFILTKSNKRPGNEVPRIHYFTKVLPSLLEFNRRKRDTLQIHCCDNFLGELVAIRLSQP